METETKNKILEALKDPDMIAALQAILTPIVNQAVTEAVKAKDEEIERLKRELADSKLKIDELEQYSRKNSLNITGLPETSGESTSQLVRDLGAMIGVNIGPADIDTCHRIGRQTTTRHRVIIVKFVRFDQRQELYAARRKLREVAAPAGAAFTRQQLASVFISDNLTPHRQSVLYVARQLKRKGKLFAAWSDVGRLKVRVHQGGNTRFITTIDDLRELVGDDPELVAPADSATAAAAPTSVPGRATAEPPPAGRETRSKRTVQQ